MRVLMLFSQYRQPGGEERSMITEADLLIGAGHEVDIVRISSPLSAARDIRHALERIRPDVAHVQNFFPHLLPRHYRIIEQAGVPVVQSLRNYRLTCMTANHWRADESCTSCDFDRHGSGIRHGCYRGSRAQSLVAAGILVTHRRTWTAKVAAYVAVSEHVRDSIVDTVAPTPVVVKPNTVVTDVVGDGTSGDVVYVGRLSPEKGIVSLAQTWRDQPELPTLSILGDGPQRATIEALAAATPNIHYAGPVDHHTALDRMGAAAATIVPWRWDEPFGRSLMESLAVGTPVIASPAALARQPVSSSAFVGYDPVRPPTLVEAVAAIRSSPERHRSAARQVFERAFSPAVVVSTLERVYRTAVG